MKDRLWRILFLSFKTLFLGAQRPKAFYLLSVLGLVSLSGCGSYSATFDCPKGEGLTCASLSEVNRQIDVGLLGGETDPLDPVVGSWSQGDAYRGRGFKGTTPCGQAATELNDGGQRACVSSLPFDVDQSIFYYPPQRHPTGEVVPGYWQPVRQRP